MNLLQPQDRRSPDAGDRRDAVVARGRLIARGIGAAILDAVVTRAAVVREGAVVADLGSGGGELLGAIHDRVRIVGVGIDLSTDAAEHAARRYPHLTWVVANADREIPLLDRCVDAIVSLHGRRHPSACARVLSGDGRLIVAFPAADDLVELREQVQGRGTERERGDAVIAEHQPFFELVERTVVRERQMVPPDGLRDLLRGTYRGARTSEAAQLTTLPALEVTLASEIVVFAPKR